MLCKGFCDHGWLPRLNRFMLSKHTLITPVHDSEEFRGAKPPLLRDEEHQFLIVNTLYGSADLISGEEKSMLLAGSDPDGVFTEKGYLTTVQEERSTFKNAYLDFMDRQENDEIQLFFVPNYSCNFACTYCYQEGYEPVKQALTIEVIDAFFDYVRKHFADRRKYVTVFGGEPLLPGENQRLLLSHLLKKASDAQLEVAFVTNGYTLLSYLDLLRKHSIREIQVTLDGTEEVHDLRRFTKGKQPTFQRIVEGIDACIKAEIPINLRMVVDKDNLNNLPKLARFAIDKGWTASPLFKTQIGRNYELHRCNSTPERLYDRASLYRAIYDVLQEYPHVAEFFQPAFSITKYLSENGELPLPLFDSCPACKTEWAFDYTGTIYSCTATVGKQGEELGTFYPSVSLNREVVESWQDRNVTTIEACRSCAMALACGGGCGSVAKNVSGSVSSPDCRPIKELLSLGAAYYLNNGANAVS
jgi:uncharacterized protein